MRKLLYLALLLTAVAAFAQTPTLVQHVATAMENNGVLKLIITLPNPALSGNCLILGIQYGSAGSITSVSDSEGNVWAAGPSTVNSAYHQQMALFYALSVTQGTKVVTVSFNGLGGVNVGENTQAVLSEFYNVATASALNGSAANPSSQATGSITTTAAGDLVYEWGAALSANNETGGGFNGTSIASGSNFTLLSADLHVGSCD